MKVDGEIGRGFGLDERVLRLALLHSNHLKDFMCLFSTIQMVSCYDLRAISNRSLLSGA